MSRLDKAATEPRRRKLRHRVRATVPRLSRFAVEHLLLLPAGVLLALAWVNIEPESYYRFTFAIAFAVNDVAIALFFALIAKEVVEATAPGGVLHPWRRAMLPVVASLGAAAVPALIHLRLVEVFDDPMLAAGWPATMATDLAIGYFVARLIFRPHPIVPLFLLLGIASDALGFVALTLFNPTREHAPDCRRADRRRRDRHRRRPSEAARAQLLAVPARRRRACRGWASTGAACIRRWHWCRSCRFSRTPRAIPASSSTRDRTPRTRSASSRCGGAIRRRSRSSSSAWSTRGVPMGALEAGTWALPLAVVAGRPVGLLAGTGVALALGFHLPHRVGWRELIVAGFIAAMGLSVGLFFSAAIFPPGQLRSELSMGVLLSLAGAPLAVAAALVAARRQVRPPRAPR